MEGRTQRKHRLARYGLAIMLAIWMTAGAVWIVTAGEPGGASTEAQPAVATDPDGDQAVVWETTDGDVVLEIFDPFGTVAGILLTMPDSGGIQSQPDVAAVSSSEFVVVWQDESDSGTKITGQRVSNFGTVAGILFQVSPSGQDPAVGADGQGNTVVAWTALDFEPRVDAFGTISGVLCCEPEDAAPMAVEPNGDNLEIPEQAHRYAHFVHRIDSFGTVAGILLRLGSTGPATPPALAVKSDGSFLVAWEDGRGNISAQAFDGDGDAFGDVFRVNESRRGRQSAPAITVALDGRYLVAWERSRRNGKERAIFARYVYDDGEVSGGEFQVSETSFSGSGDPAVAADHRGHALVTWRCDHQDGTDVAILGRTVDLDGDAEGSEFQVGSAATAAMGDVALGNATSDFVVVWQGQKDDEGSGSCVFIDQLTVPLP